MSLIQEILIQSNENNFDTSGSKNRVSFDIPEDDYDLSQSYVQIEVETIFPSVEQTYNGAVEPGIFDAGILYLAGSGANSNFLISNNGTQYIKNAEIMNDNSLIESSINNDVFRGNLQALVTNDEWQQSTTYNGGTLNARSKGQVMNQPLKVLDNKNSSTSASRTNLMKIYLKDIFGLCQVSNYNSSAFGDLKLKLEMQFQKLDPVSVTPPLDLAYNNGVDASNNDLMNAFEPSAGSTTGITSVKSLISKVKYKDSQYPYWVGQKLNYTCTNDGTAVAANVVKIQSISQAVTGEITISFTEEIVSIAMANPVKSVTLNTLAYLPPSGAGSLLIGNINLNMFRYTAPQKSAGKIQFNYFTSMRDMFPPGNSMISSYMIPANTINVYLTFPEAGHVYSIDVINSYRISIDNEPLYEGDIVYNGPIHNNLIMQSSINSGQIIAKTLMTSLKSYNNNNTGYANVQQLYLLTFPCELKPVQQLLELNISGTLGGNIQLNFERIKLM